jgi:hypothetical protein
MGVRTEYPVDDQASSLLEGSNSLSHILVIDIGDVGGGRWRQVAGGH